jgi:dihydroorotate dehydrogenase
VRGKGGNFQTLSQDYHKIVTRNRCALQKNHHFFLIDCPMPTLAETLAYLDHLARPALTSLPAPFSTWLYSTARNPFLARFSAEHPSEHMPPSELERVLWGMRFRSGLLNAAGVFKNGEGVYTCFRQGAGGFLAGTTTAEARTGNARAGIRKPFAPYPRSGAASNWLGLPNTGHEAVAKRLAAVCSQRQSTNAFVSFPIGASLMISPATSYAAADQAKQQGLQDLQGLRSLVSGMKSYIDAGVDFLEINESCPNVAHGASTLEAIGERLEYVRRELQQLRQSGMVSARRVPIIVKFSADTSLDDAPRLVDMLHTLGYDGVNFGNTSTLYAAHRSSIHAAEQPAYDYFTTTFGGGVSGAPLRASVLALVQAAHKHWSGLQTGGRTSYEFHIVCTGGIASGSDVHAAERAGAALCQWYTGYFEGFARHGHGVYARLYDDSRTTV